MTKNSMHVTSTAPAVSNSKATETWHSSRYDSAKTDLESRVFDLFDRGNHNFHIECGQHVYDIEIGFETCNGIYQVIARVTDLVHGITRTNRGRASCAYQFQYVGWYINLADINQVRDFLTDTNNPESLKAVVRLLLKGNITVGDSHSRRSFNSVRSHILSARRRNDRNEINDICRR